MKNLNKFIAIGFTVLATGVAGAVSLSDCTKEGATITIGADASFPKYEGWMPRGEANKVVLWQNKKLSDIKAIRAKMSGASVNIKDSYVTGIIETRTETALRIEFQLHDDWMKMVIVYLCQDGDDVVGWVSTAGHAYQWRYGKLVEEGKDGWYGWSNVATSPTESGYGVYNIEVLNVLETTPTELTEYAATVGESGTDTLQVNDGMLILKVAQTNEVFDINIKGNVNISLEKEEDITVDVLNDVQLTRDAPTLAILPGYRLDGVEVVSATSYGNWLGKRAFQIFHTKRENGKLTFQAQVPDGVYTKGVIVELTETSAGLQVRRTCGFYAYASSWPLGSDFSVNTPNRDSDQYAQAYGLSSLVLKVLPSVLYSAKKEGGTGWGTTVDGVMMRVTNQPLPAYSWTTVSNGGVLKLDVSSGGNYSKDSDNRRYVVKKDSHLILAESMSIAEGGFVALDGGSLRMLNDFLYVNLLSITNGGSIVGSTTCRAGYGRDVTWNIYGPDPVTIEPGIELTANWITVTVKSEAPTTIVGSLKDAGGYAGATFAKDGAATLTLGSENYNAGSFKVVAGELIFANPKGIKSNNAVILGGGYVGPRAG